MLLIYSEYGLEKGIAFASRAFLFIRKSLVGSSCLFGIGKAGVTDVKYVALILKISMKQWLQVADPRRGPSET